MFYLRIEAHFCFLQHDGVRNVYFLSYVHMNPVTKERCVHFLKSLLRQTFLIKTPIRGSFFSSKRVRFICGQGNRKREYPSSGSEGPSIKVRMATACHFVVFRTLLGTANFEPQFTSKYNRAQMLSLLQLSCWINEKSFFTVLPT